MAAVRGAATLAVGGAGAVLVWHVGYQTWKHGLCNAFLKSMLRKGSWTASLWHFWAMWDRSALMEDPTLTEQEKVQKDRNINGRYVRRTGEHHPPDKKDELRAEARAQTG
mmetsp:Transcript_23850/g.52584  ORF Transcript_23850/g.52584 Transcript_23850/m.52584 type:complete len:110 (+) Transcript_23850:22-351(+)